MQGRRTAYLGDIQSHGLRGARTKGLLLGTVVADERREGKRQPQQDAGKKGWQKAWCLNSEAGDKAVVSGLSCILLLHWGRGHVL